MHWSGRDSIDGSILLNVSANPQHSSLATISVAPKLDYCMHWVVLQTSHGKHIHDVDRDEDKELSWQKLLERDDCICSITRSL